jgi:hypothetical protein
MNKARNNPLYYRNLLVAKYPTGTIVVGGIDYFKAAYDFLTQA